MHVWFYKKVFLIAFQACGPLGIPVFLESEDTIIGFFILIWFVWMAIVLTTPLVRIPWPFHLGAAIILLFLGIIPVAIRNV
jgi:hypothetical protein